MSSVLLYEMPDRDWTGAAVPAIGLALVLALATAAVLIAAVRAARARAVSTLRLIALAATAALLIGIGVSVATGMMSAFRAGDSVSWLVVCGTIHDFHTEQKPNTGHERFKVADVEFEYSDYGPPGLGYRKTQSRGGVFQSGMRIRVHYVKSGRYNVIVRAESIPENSGEPCDGTATP